MKTENQLNDENFEEKVSGAVRPILVDFWMTGCFPCLLLKPVLEKIAQEFQGKIIFAQVNLDDAPITVQKHDINVAPTVVLFKKGKPVSFFAGVKKEEEIRFWLEENLKSGKEEHETSSQEKDLSSLVSDAILRYKDYAEKKNFSLNPNKKVVESIVKGLLEREKRYGERYCPCRKVSGNREEDKKIICPCLFHFDELEKKGRCLCGLFVKKEIK